MELYRHSMEFHGHAMETPWSSMELHGIPWNSMEFHGMSWNSMGLFHTGSDVGEAMDETAKDAKIIRRRFGAEANNYKK